MNEPPEPAQAEIAQPETGWKLQFGALCLMLVMALVGMGLSQAEGKGAWEYWVVVVFVYAALGIWRSTLKAKRAGQPISQLIGRELAHWGMLLMFMGILLLLERKALVDRESASDFALLLLAFSCCLAGIHFDWLLLVMGIALTLMAIAAATLEQYAGVLWVVMSAIAIVAACLFYWRAKRGAKVVDGH